jgi:predicted deacetylase
MSGATLCVVVHDVADATHAACERLLAAVEAVAPVPLTFLAVPRYHGAAPAASFEQWLGERSRRGDELALHGYTHRDDGTPRGAVDRLRRRVYTRGEGEFWDLDAPTAARQLRAGIDWFERNGWPLRGFVAPAWLLGPGAWQALRDTRFAYTATLRHIHLLPEAGRITSQSIVYSTSTAWRRQLTPGACAFSPNPVLRRAASPRRRCGGGAALVAAPARARPEGPRCRDGRAALRALAQRPCRLRRRRCRRTPQRRAQSRLKLIAAVSAPTAAPTSTSLG